MCKLFVGQLKVESAIVKRTSKSLSVFPWQSNLYFLALICVVPTNVALGPLATARSAEELAKEKKMSRRRERARKTNLK